MLWTTWAPRWLPWPIESYINGVHNLGHPQTWLFPIFPWAGFAFAGLAIGFFLQTDFAKNLDGGLFALVACAGVLFIGLGRWLDSMSPKLYAVYDYWHTSPEFFLARVGILLMVLALSYGWCRWGAGQWGFSPLVQLGQTSLLVYWVHLEFVYGRLSILPKKATDVRAASIGLLTIFLSMLVLSILRTKLKGRRAKVPQPDSRPIVLKAPTVAG
jgi:fucose 4-O-acetylase-like acetyltransferase